MSIFQTDKTGTQLMREIAKQFNINMVVNNNDDNLPDDPVPSVEPVHSSLVNILLAKHLQNAREVPSSLDEEVRRFFNQKHNGEDALQFWKKNETHFPRLASIAKVLLCIPATSASSESAFSVAGCLLRKRRASIAPHKVQKVLFVHDNFDLLKF